MRRANLSRGVAFVASVAMAAGILLAPPVAASLPSSPSRSVPASDTSGRSAQDLDAPAVGIILRIDGRARVSEAATRSMAAVVESAGLDVDAIVPVASRAGSATSSIRFDEVVPWAEAQAVAEVIAQRPGVRWAHPDGISTIAEEPAVPNDERFAKQWGLWDPKAPVVDASTRAPIAWQRTKGSSDVVVAVVDSGITAHPDLDANVLPGYDFISEASRARDGDGRDPDATDEGDWVDAEAVFGIEFCFGDPTSPSSWHGTHVAGTVAAIQGNGIGVSGVAPQARILPVRALGTCGGASSDIAAAITWASGGTVPGVPANPHPADVVNLSIGSKRACPAVYAEAIAGAIGRGSTVIAAAGNDAGPAKHSSPANCEGVITVAATNRDGRLAEYSNFGLAPGEVDIAAPGGDFPYDGGVLSTVDEGLTVPTGPGYRGKNGTSMAAPHVSGAAALLHAAGIDDPAMIREALLGATRDYPTLGGYGTRCTLVTCGAGLLDLSRLFIPPAPHTLTWKPIGTTGVRLDWSRPRDSAAGPISRYVIEQSTDRGVTWEGIGTATELGFTVTNLNSSTAYNFRVAAEAGGMLSAWSTPTPTIRLAMSWSSPVPLGEFVAGSVAVNARGDGIAAVLTTRVGPESAGTRIAVYRYVEGLWQPPDIVPIPEDVPIMRDPGPLRVAVSNSGQAVIALEASMQNLTTYERRAGVFASYSTSIYEPDNFTTLGRVHGDGEVPGGADVGVAMADGGGAIIAWGGVAVNGDYGGVYATVRTPTLGWSTPRYLGISYYFAARYVHDVAAEGTRATVAFIQGFKEACKDPQGQKVNCWAPRSITYDFASNRWGGETDLDAPALEVLSGIQVARSGDSEAYIWGQQVPDPYLSGGSDWFHPRGVIMKTGVHAGVQILDVPESFGSYRITDLAMSEDGEAVAVAEGQRWFSAWYGPTWLDAVDVFETRDGRWGFVDTLWLQPSGEPGGSPPALALSPHSATREGAMIAWKGIQTTAGSAARRVNAEWIPVVDPVGLWSESDIAPSVSVDASGAAVLMTAAHSTEATPSTGAVVVYALGNRGLRTPPEPSGLVLRDSLTNSGRDGVDVIMDRPLARMYYDPVGRSWTRQRYFAQLYRVDDDSIVTKVDGATCDVADSYTETMLCSVEESLPNGTYVARAYTMLDGIRSDRWSPWSDPFVLARPETPMAPQGLLSLDNWPSQPVSGLKAKPGKKQVAFTWRAPLDDGGEPVAQYRYRTRVGTGPWSAWMSTSKTSVTQRVRASRLQVAIEVVTVRSPVRVQWLAPIYPGASPIVSYQVEARLASAGEASWKVLAGDVKAEAFFYAPASLTPGTYLFRVTARNAKGAGEPAISAESIVGAPVLGPVVTAKGTSK